MPHPSIIPNEPDLAANGTHSLSQQTDYPKNYLSPLGEKIFLDRYAWKDGSKQSLAVGDTVIVCVDESTRQREIATVETLDRSVGKATVRLRDDTTKVVAIEHIDKPLETTPAETMARIARGIAAVEPEATRAEWEENFKWLLEDWKFVPGGRIWAGAGTDQNLTFYNCMPPDQLVLTEEGYKPITEVQVGERVVTHCNRLRPVLHKFERETEEPLYVIRTKESDALRLTGEHKVLALPAAWVQRGQPQREAAWIPARELKLGDYLASVKEGNATEAVVSALPALEQLVANGKHGSTQVNGHARPALEYDFEQEGLLWGKIETISTEPYRGRVLDIEVEEDHSFISAGLVVSNCYVIPSPRDSRGGIVKTLSQMMEIMSRGGGVGINVSSLRPRYSYVKGVNGRSSGAVSWGALYSFVTGLIEQGGCFGPNERILTDRGLIPAKELADRLEAGEPILAQTHEGLRPFTAYFRNGSKPLFEVTTKRGYKVRVSADHKMAVLRNGAITTIPLRDLAVKDEILLLLGHGVEADYVRLEESAYERSIMSTNLNTDVNLPTELDEDFAYLIGYMHGDGYIQVHKKVTWQAPKAFKLATADDHPTIRARLQEIIRTKFGLEPLLEDGDGALKNVVIYSRVLIEWLIQNSLLKAKSEDIRVPEVIFRSPTSVMAAFIAGYFDADGCNRGRKGGYGFDSVSREMLEDVQQLLAINGIVSRIAETDRSEEGWQTLYRLSVTGAPFKRRFAALIPAEKTSDDNGKRDMYNTYPAEVWTSLGARSKYQQRIYDGVSSRISFSQLSKIGERLANDGQVALAERLDHIMHTLPDKIISIELLGDSDVYDFEVEDVHLLSGGGIYTHNSRRGALMVICNDWHPDVIEFIHSKREMGKITNANISVGISDTFMQRVKEDSDWDLVFPDTSVPQYDDLWDGDLDKWKAAGYPVIKYKTVKAREIWNQIIESAWASAEPGLWFRERSNKMSNSWYFNPLVSTNPCGEQPLSAFSVCNLGALNLARFVEEGKVEWAALGRTVRYATRFLDDVIDATPYFFEENAQQQLGERRVGLGVMGLAEMMIRLGLRYGSAEGNAFLDELFRFITSEAYSASSDFAAEKGAFPAFVADKFLQSGFMQGMPEEIRQKVAEQGIRNVTLLTVAPTGCVAPDTLVSTATGLRPIVQLGNPEGEQWQPLTQQVHTDEGLRATSHFFVNGYRPVKTMTTRRGFSLTATPNHRIRVLDEQGNYLWRRMDELQPGERVVLKKNTMGAGEVVPLVPVEQGVNSLSGLPKQMTPELAELLGLYMGDGYLKDTGGIHIVVAQEDPDLLERVKSLLQHIWGQRNTPVEERIGCWTVSLNGRYIPRFFEANGLAKPKGNHGEGAAGAFVPAKVLQAGRECVIAFLRGIFETDGGVHRGTITLTSTSLTMIRQVQVALLALGIAATIRPLPEVGERFGDRERYELRILNRRESEKFVAEIGFLSERKRRSTEDMGAMCDRGDSVPLLALCKEFYAHSKGLKNEVRQTILQRTSNGALTQQFVRAMVAEYPMLADSQLARLVAMDFFLDEVATIEDGMCDTYDLSVPDNETYIANGFVSHNTTGTMVNTSTGIEPYYFWSYFRKSRLGTHEEVVDVVREWREAHPGQPLPDYFVTAMDLSPEDHVRVQAAVQRWIDSSISKCVTGDTLVLTSRGLVPIAELSDLRDPDQFEPLELEVITPTGTEKTEAFYYGGMRETRRASLSYGYEIEGTPNHRVHRLEADGSVQFARMDELKIGDTVVLYSGQQVFGPGSQPLPAYSGQWKANAKRIEFPTHMSIDLAFVLGSITSEGSIHRNGVLICNGDRDLLERIGVLFKELFGLESHIYPDKRRDSVYNLQVNSRPLCHWLLNDLGMLAGAENKIIPTCIFTASHDEIAAFLRSLMLDGYMTLNGRLFGINLASRALIRQLQTLLLNFGVFSRIQQSAERAWALTVAGEALDILATFLEFEEVWKTERIGRRNEGRILKPSNYATLMPRPLTYALQEMRQDSSKSLRALYGGGPDYNAAKTNLNQGARLRRDAASSLYGYFDDAASAYANQFFEHDQPGCLYVEVQAIERGFAEVFDLTVPGSHSFIANGLCNHNTSNVPNHYTVEQTAKLYELMYELGCKGGTIYRDGSRDEQVLNLKEEDKAEKKESKAEVAPAPAPEVSPNYTNRGDHKRARPRSLKGATYFINTPVGKAYVTVNRNGGDQPFEVFANVGKMGSEGAAMSEAIGRLISLVLRLPSHISPSERLEMVISQLEGIGGSRSIGFGPNRVTSLPDALAQVLREDLAAHRDEDTSYLLGEAEPEPKQLELLASTMNADLCPECGHSTFVRIEGCKKCYSCGHSEC